MKARFMMTAVLAGILACALLSFGQPMKKTETPPTSKPAGVLSTEMSGVDTLDVIPKEVLTRSGAGTRRVNLETTVFRRQEPVQYASGGLRDPFRALIVNEKKEGEIKTDLLRLDGAVLTGIVWSAGDYVAMVRDKDNRSFFLRKADKVYHGRVLEVEQSRVVFEVSEFGDYRRIVLEVQG